MICSMNFPCAHLRQVQLADRTTLRVGGVAEHLLEPADPDELREALAAVRETGLPYRLLGGGANVIIADGVIPGVTIATARLRRTFRHVPRELRADAHDDAPLDPFTEGAPRLQLPEEEHEPRLVAWAGSSMPGLVNTAKSLGWSGLEGLAGVPGSIGGGLVMNAGGSWGELWDVVETVRVIDEAGGFRDLPRECCSPRYRDGGLGAAVVAGVVLRLERSTKREVEEAVRRYLQHKRDVQPVTEWSAGCMFKNPDREASGGKGAGLLIEESGGKGLTVGDAQVSEKHGNFVVNRGRATAGDVLAVVERVQALVAERTGIELAREVKVWGAEAAR